MPLNEGLLGEFNQEMAGVRKTLERVPADKLAWQPHPKSMIMGRLAAHLAEIPAWVSLAIEQDSFDLQPPGAPPYQRFVPNNVQEVLDLFDKNIAKARQALTAVSDESLSESWSLLMTGNTIFTMPRLGVVRSMVLNHMIHHRAQLGVYLRLNDVPVPAIYGPSADEKNM
jgi:uncharacterized damage-inducible protein DinB